VKCYKKTKTKNNFLRLQGKPIHENVGGRGGDGLNY